jgi:hypothetical protein
MDGIQKGLKLALTGPEAYLLGTALIGAANKEPALRKHPICRHVQAPYGR